MSDSQNEDEVTTVALVAHDGTRIELEGQQYFGRAPDNDHVLTAPRVSGRHALLHVDGATLTVQDLESSNGTTVNGKLIKREIELNDGDILCLANICYLVSLPPPECMGDDSVEPDVTVVSSASPQADFASSEHTIFVPLESANPAASRGEPLLDIQDDERTRLVASTELPVVNLANNNIERRSHLPHLLILGTSGEAVKRLELAIEAGDGPDIWELGRNASCQIVLDDSTVSDRHAQLHHDHGEWRLVNLLASNGMFVNDTRKLSATLADGDIIRLGQLQILFRLQSNKPGDMPIQPSRKPLDEPSQDAPLSPHGGKLGVIAALVLLLSVAAIYLAFL